MTVFMGNLTALLLVVLLVAVCIRELLKGHRSGGCAGGCAGCSGGCASCGGGRASCGGCSLCAERSPGREQ